MFAFGLCNYSASFQMLLAHMFNDKPMISYIDKILIYGQKFEQHRTHLPQVFLTLAELQLKVKIEKYHLTLHKVELLTH